MTDGAKNEGDEMHKPTRRELLRYSGTVAAGTVLVSALPSRAKALEGFASELSQANHRVTPPSAAAQHEFHRLTFADDFTSLSTIDINNTLAPGYRWYMANTMIPQDSPDGTIHTGVVQAPTSVSVANSILTFTSSAKSGGWLTNVGYKGASAPRTVGTPIAASGGYFECRMAFDPNFQPTTSWKYPFQY